MNLTPLPPIKSIPEYAFDALTHEIERFQSRLASDMELGVISTGAGQAIHVEAVRYAGQMVVIDGTDSEGRQARIIQHYTQVSIQMVALPKQREEARRIGF